MDIESIKGLVFCIFKIEFLLYYNIDNKNLFFYIVIYSIEVVWGFFFYYFLFIGVFYCLDIMILVLRDFFFYIWKVGVVYSF